MAQRGDSKLSSPPRCLRSERQAPVISGLTQQSQVLTLLVQGQLMQGTDQLWLTAEDKKSAAHLQVQVGASLSLVGVVIKHKFNVMTEMAQQSHGNVR